MDRENPRGWKDVGKQGTKQQCLDYIEEVWTDMRPLSLRKKMEEMEARIKKDAIVFDCRTLSDDEVAEVAGAVARLASC